MHLNVRNVNEAFRELVKFFDDGANDRLSTFYRGVNRVIRNHSRNGDVLVIDEPVTVTYTHPTERVLFNEVRDANPAFHLYEALWMLAGRNDVAPLAYYNSRMNQFSDDGKTLNGAYGYRWRHAWRWNQEIAGDVEIDQLDVLVNHLKADPHSRRAVLSMWNVEDDLLKIGWPCNRCQEYEGGVCPHCTNGLKMQSKDVCCNLDVMFSLRDDCKVSGEQQVENWYKVLDMTVTNRSNDMLWGMLGANYVHFSILQEYMAARLGVGVGRYHHFSNNVHVYCDRPDWKPEELLDWCVEYPHPYEIDPRVKVTIPLVQDPAVFEQELPKFVEANSKEPLYFIPSANWSEPFLRDVAQPLLNAYHCHKRSKGAGMDFAERVAADDWRIAVTSWLTRRAERVGK